MGLELLEGGNLSEYLKQRYKNKYKLTDKEASDLMRGILEGIAYVHEKGITHRDLKPGNILIQDRNNLQSVKLIDFGLGLMKRRADITCGTQSYMAPEIVISTKIYSKSVDIWAIGIILHMVLTGGNHPLGDPNKNRKDQDWKEILRNQRTNVEGDPSISKVARSLF